MIFKLKRIHIIIFAVCITTIAALSLGLASRDVYKRDYDLAASDDSYVAVPIIMYHGVLDGRDNTYIIPVETLEQDLDFLKSNNFNTVVMQDLINFVHYRIALPKNPIMITFDDGFFNNITNGENLLKERGFRAVISIVGEFSQASTDTGDINERYSYLTWQQINELVRGGVFEVQNHSWGLHHTGRGYNGAKKSSRESAEEYEKRLTADVMRLQAHIFAYSGVRPTTFSYPFGAHCDESERVLQTIGFRATLGAHGGIAILKPNQPQSLFLLPRNNRTPHYTTEEFFARILP